MGMLLDKQITSQPEMCNDVNSLAGYVMFITYIN